MKIKGILSVPILLFCTILSGQEIQLIKETVDKNNLEVKHVYRVYPNGKKMKIVASGPNITINKNGTYQKQFTEENIDRGN